MASLDMGEPRHLTLYDGRELVGAIDGAGRCWHAIDALGRTLPGAPFKSQRAAIGAVNAARLADPCAAADARLDNS